MDLSRRAFLGASAALGFVPAAWAAPLAERRLVVIVLRGGMDGLHAVPPLGDPAYEAARGGLALKAEGGAPRLDSTFALHPALSPLLPLWQARELALVHAVASPYRERSHFDGQDVLESGATRPHALKDGWLNRAVAALGNAPALAVSQSLPLLLRGPAKASSWAPSPLPGLPPARLAALRALFAGDPLLSMAFEEGVQMDTLATEALAAEPGMAGGARKVANAFPALAGAAGSLMAAPAGPRLAVMELGGWDTHSGQLGRMNQPLGQLAEGINALARALGPAWKTTIVVAASEFGRTVAENGTGGSDHGTGGAMILAGGAVAGGKVFTDWPGLDKARLYQSRDLLPTLDSRAVFKAILRDHLGVTPKVLDGAVFPDSAAVRPVEGLVRA
ncbi:hypothetical protein CCC_00521 [Paramagnetospirillum magnetotacticum MS-1]|uniref:DUF1501 domain-containing protein n=1 Tax=Paramagnetospirillum magnetotacticum MS-1 TaxID=272627 RepID=A0A0C2YRX8_PARME|nr:DUF1501 domain-containing protein [Paramagnetospirillum magnetotacticum]KIL97460.1 hypothetical protein CCC_00521 [Paramagnetospirillum magnetotacticum MS-1]